MLNGLGKTQQKMLTGLIQNSDGMTISEIVKSLKISRTAVNQHITALGNNGYVENHMLTTTGGRPSQRYTLTNKGKHLFPKQYAWFSALLLKNIKLKFGKEELEIFLRGLGEEVAGNYSKRLGGKNASEKVDEIASIMKELGYESRSFFSEGDIISACNCVYHDLASETPEVCSFDLALLSAMSGRKVEHSECMVRGGSKCCFKIKENLLASENSDYQVLDNTH